MFISSPQGCTYVSRETKLRGETEVGQWEISVRSAVNPPPCCPPAMTVIELREPLLTDN